MSTTETPAEAGEGGARSPLPRLPLRMDKRALVRLAVCTVTLWLLVLLLALLVAVAVYISQANQILVVSCVAVISFALVVATCKLNAIAGISKIMKEDAAAKSDPPPTYDDVLHSEVPPPPYYAVVSEAGGGGASNPATPAVTRGKVGLWELQPSKRSSPQACWRSPAFRRWLGRPGILHSLVSPTMFRAPKEQSSTSITSTKAVKASMDSCLALRRSSSTPSLAGLAAPRALARWPSSPSLCDSCGWF